MQPHQHIRSREMQRPGYVGRGLPAVVVQTHDAPVGLGQVVYGLFELLQLLFVLRTILIGLQRAFYTVYAPSPGLVQGVERQPHGHRGQPRPYRGAALPSSQMRISPHKGLLRYLGCQVLTAHPPMLLASTMAE